MRVRPLLLVTALVTPLLASEPSEGQGSAAPAWPRGPYTLARITRDGRSIDTHNIATQPSSFARMLWTFDGAHLRVAMQQARVIDAGHLEACEATVEIEVEMRDGQMVVPHASRAEAVFLTEEREPTSEGRHRRTRSQRCAASVPAQVLQLVRTDASGSAAPTRFVVQSSEGRFEFERVDPDDVAPSDFLGNVE